MKTLILSVAASVAMLSAHAGEVKWLTSLPEAQAKAKAEHKLVFMEFTGSDWCPPCKMLHKKVLETEAFANYAQKNLVLVELDFPNTKKQSDDLKKANRALAERFEIEGYPTVVILDAEGKELYRAVGFSGDSAEDYIARLEKGLGK